MKPEKRQHRPEQSDYDESHYVDYEEAKADYDFLKELLGGPEDE